MGQGTWARRRRLIGPLFVMFCGVLAIAVVVVGVMWIGEPRNGVSGTYQSIAEQGRGPLRR